MLVALFTHACTQPHLHVCMHKSACSSHSHQAANQERFGTPVLGDIGYALFLKVKNKLVVGLIFISTNSCLRECFWVLHISQSASLENKTDRSQKASAVLCLSVEIFPPKGVNI